MSLPLELTPELARKLVPYYTSQDLPVPTPLLRLLPLTAAARTYQRDWHGRFGKGGPGAGEGKEGDGKPKQGKLPGIRESHRSSITADDLAEAGITDASRQSRIIALNDELDLKYGKSLKTVENASEAVMAGDVPMQAVAYVRDGDVLGVNPAMLTDAVAATNVERGWLCDGDATVEGVITHEFAHELLGHSSEPKPQIITAKRIAADAAARTPGNWDEGIFGSRIGTSLSDYARQAYTSSGGNWDEPEAELFSEYHWGGKKRPAWVVTWGETFHKQLGLDPTPLSELTK